MRFWDSSAVVQLLVAHDRSSEMEALLEADPLVAVWLVSPFECVSALSRLEREGSLVG